MVTTALQRVKTVLFFARTVYTHRRITGAVSLPRTTGLCTRGVTFGAITVLLVQIRVFWDVTPCLLVNGYRRFGRGCCFQL